MEKKEISTGNCFICGAELGKVKMKNHVIKEHTQTEGGESAVLVRAEGMDKNYWLLLDIEANAVLSDLDSFLRKIWLECCGHMSVFSLHRFDGNEFAMRKKISDFSTGDKLCYMYDMGSTTELMISIVGETRRPKQKAKVRLLARNVAPEITCSCGKPATTLCSECMYDADNPFLCDGCAETHEHEEMMLPVTNSPRMGECAYDGYLDKWTFEPGKFGKGDTAANPKHG
jgi:hypothetical protein